SRASRAEADRGPGIAPWIVVGSGGAAIVTGGVLWLVQSSRLSSLDDKIAQTDASGLIVGTTPSEVSSEVSGINTLRVVSGVLVGVGVAAAGGGLAWWLFGGSGSAPSVAVAPIVGAGGTGLGVSGTF
ncbi:hypothetical protein L6R52_42625, partial [Myxococcota bacterium]|nr:hypothetical protein [Myxococcota bacterium]